MLANKIMKVSVFSVTHYQILLTSTSSNAVTDIGPETAALSLNASACGDRTPCHPATRFGWWAPEAAGPAGSSP
ncbi:hypothetical protein [Phytohabitans rumicis]|uniref:hypothetical protein n=1 Tax=Phytohabitans rumicis TaxID=1076125 RepID=UPI001566DC87|nr:hypothetical protein [Phytohabitans rumicis]